MHYRMLKSTEPLVPNRTNHLLALVVQKDHRPWTEQGRQIQIPEKMVLVPAQMVPEPGRNPTNQKAHHPLWTFDQKREPEPCYQTTLLHLWKMKAVQKY